MVQRFTEAFVQALQVPEGPTSDSGLKMEVLKVHAFWWGGAGSLQGGLTSLIFVPYHL